MTKRRDSRVSAEMRRRSHMVDNFWADDVERGARVACLQRDCDGWDGFFVFWTPEELANIRGELPPHRLLGIIRAK